MEIYLVTWQIPIDAESPADAARQALRIQRDPHSIATVFRVEHDGIRHREWLIDIEDPDEAIFLEAT